MKFSVYLTEDDKKQLQYEVVSTELKVHLTRILERKENFQKHSFIQMNRFINRSRNLAGKPIYVLEADDWGGYEDCEYAWHNGEYELVFRRLDNLNFIEFLGEVIEGQWFTTEEINELLEKDGASFRYVYKSGELEISVIPLAELENNPHTNEHPNIRVLVARMESSLSSGDYAGVLHSSASIFETLAKDIVGLPTIQDKTLKSFFDRYKKDSQLPEELQNKILSTYEDRNSTPLAGHGSTSAPSITKEEAITLSELTKAFVKIEYILQLEAASENKS